MAKQWDVKITGTAAIAKRARDGGMKGLMASARRIEAASLQEVPVDEGDLRDSSFVEQVDERTVAVGYRDPKAAAAHENMQVSYRGGRSAKYLERPFTADAGVTLVTLARSVREAIGG